LLLAATVRSFALMPLGISDRNTVNISARFIVSLLRFIVTTYLDNSIPVIWHHWRDRQDALGKLVMKMCGLQQVFVT